MVILANVWAFADQRGGDLFMIRRREFIAGLCGATAWPLVARAQQRTLPVIGLLDTSAGGRLSAIRRGFVDAGFIDGENVTIEYRHGNANSRQLQPLATDLVSRGVSVIVALGSIASVRAAMAATTTIPIVFVYGGDPVEDGFVESLNKPGGNVTGLSIQNAELAGKRLELLHKMVPQAATVAFLSGTPSFTTYKEQTTSMFAAGRKLDLEVIVVECRSGRDFDAAFATISQRRAEALILGAFPLGPLDRVIALAAHDKIPAIYTARRNALGGGLMSYGADVRDNLRQVAIQYVGRIIKNERPADLPVQQSTKFEMVINLKTAKALGLEIPPTLLALADEVIE
jgi:putative ABC transport system substrate-binding protein